MKLFDETRKRLVETGTRNRLIHVNRANKRGNMLNISNGQSDDVFAILASSRPMHFLPTGRDTVPEGGDEPDSTGIEPHNGSHRSSDAILETRLSSDALQKRLLRLAREAKTAEEESGINILYLALGFVTWFEDKSSAVPREAPLVLLPVELVRNAKTSTYDLRIREEDVETNLPLQQRWKDDFGIDLPPLEIDENWRPSSYFDAVRAIIDSRDRWKIDTDGIQLGFFSFSKLLMFRDLSIDAWPAGAIASHALTRGLLYEGFESESPLFSDEDRLDDVLPPQKLFHVVDADASQAKVIEEVRTGRNLVVQGPPGTGKSQTITNIIAAAVNDGKRVLFVAEKMAALSVVHSRLVKVGLRDTCLELHSRSANKKTVLGELARTISAAQSPAQTSNGDASLLEVRDRLNRLSDLLHSPLGQTGETPYSLIGAQCHFLNHGVAPPKLYADVLVTLSREDERKLLEAVAEFGALLESEGNAATHPLASIRRLDLQPVELTRIEGKLAEAHTAIEAFSTAIAKTNLALATTEISSLSNATHFATLLTALDELPDTNIEIIAAVISSGEFTRLREGLAAGVAYRDEIEKCSAKFTASAFEVSLAHLRSPLARGAASFWARLGSAYRAASVELATLLREPLPKAASSRLNLVDMLSEVAAKREIWDTDNAYCAQVFGAAWRGVKSDFNQLSHVIEWAARLHAEPPRGPLAAALALAKQPTELRLLRKTVIETAYAARDQVQRLVAELNFDIEALTGSDLEHADLSVLGIAFKRMAPALDHYQAWCRMASAEECLRTAGVGQLVDAMQRGKLDSRSAAVELRFARVERLWKMAVQKSEDLQQFGVVKRQELVSRFVDLERKKLHENSTGIRARHLQQVPQGAQGEMAVIRGEIAKKRWHIPLRKLFTRAGEAVQRIKPVLLMSPISVAQFLPPGKLKFDILVIDEASQVRPEDALGAIARADQIVVVGDKKQLPPTSFFDRLLADEEDLDDEEAESLLHGAASASSMESILTLCEARGLGSRMLKWHYRSRDPSLITVSNREFYDNELVLPPSPLQKDPSYGLSFTRVDGLYDRGGKRDNRKEGEALVDRVASHARSQPSLSLGIVTFSFAQSNLITELLDARRKADPVLDAFLREGQNEDVFVKNIENVQGDERDVILVSVGYGPSSPGGRPSSSFGPVNGDGGERRLNVLFTRARVRCEVFASFDPEDMDVSRSAQVGPRILKRFLDFAKHGRIDESAPTGEAADSPFEEDVAEVVRSFGFLADPQVGSAGFRIDMGIRHPDKPGSYLLAVECDGATYHGALWARERDRLRQEVLENLGWRFHRIWSTDWFYNRKVEVERLRQALFDARHAAENGIHIDGANQAAVSAAEAAESEPKIIDAPEIVVRQMPFYKRYQGRIRAPYEPHDAPLPLLVDLVTDIVNEEGPIHVDEVARRVGTSFGKEKAGSRILAAARTALLRAKATNQAIRTDGDFWFTEAQEKAPPVRDRSQEFGATLKAASISMLEIREAVRTANEDNAGGADEDVIRSAARLLGFQRVGSELSERIAEGL